MVPFMPSRYRIILAWSSIVLAVILLPSCSDSAAIAKELEFVRQTTKSAESKMFDIVTETKSPEPDLGKIAALASGAISDLHSIDSSTESASRHLTGVKDVTPAWMEMLIWLSIAAAIVAVVVLAWRFGIDRFVASLLSWIRFPSRDATAAKMDADAEAESPTPALRESIAAKRASSPRYDLEYRKHRRSLDAESGRIVRKETNKP